MHTRLRRLAVQRTALSARLEQLSATHCSLPAARLAPEAAGPTALQPSGETGCRTGGGSNSLGLTGGSSGQYGSMPLTVTEAKQRIFGSFLGTSSAGSLDGSSGDDASRGDDEGDLDDYGDLGADEVVELLRINLACESSVMASHSMVRPLRCVVCVCAERWLYLGCGCVWLCLQLWLWRGWG